MRKKVVLIAILIFTFFLSSCSDVYEEIVIVDQNEYQSIWTLPERRADDISLLFPDSIEDKEVVNFSCTHTTYFPVGTGWQVELIVKYDDESFHSEVERLQNICQNSIICGESEYFDVPAYVTVWNWNGCFEYAVINEKDSTIGYVYLQLISKNDLKISSDLIPDKYKMDMSDSQIYIVYQQYASW